MVAEDATIVNSSVEVTISTGVFSAENSQRFALHNGGSLRIGRDAANHVTLDLPGVSATHAELLYQKAEGDEGEFELCICDHSRNGTAVRPGPHVPDSSWLNKIPPAWERLAPGVPRALGHGWQVLTPARSRKGDSQMPFHKRMITVYTKSPGAPAPGLQEPHAKDPAYAPPRPVAGAAATPEEEAARARRERKRRQKEELARAAAAVKQVKITNPVQAAHDRRVGQVGAVEEELARRDKKAKSAQQILEEEEAAAAQRAVAAAAAMRGTKKKAVTPGKLAELAQKGAPITEIQSDDEAPVRAAPLTAANVAKLGGGPPSVIDFDMRSISPISAPGVKPKKKEKRKVARSPSRMQKPKLIKRSKASPDRWDSSAKASKKRRAGSEEERRGHRNRSREKRKDRR